MKQSNNYFYTYKSLKNTNCKKLEIFKGNHYFNRLNDCSE